MNLYKICLLGIAIFYNTACDGYYESDKNPFKVSGQCDNDIYRYSKQDLADEEFGKIGVVSNTQEYPRAGVSKVFTHRSGRMLSIEGSFASLCKSSIINKVKMELRNTRGGLKTYYPNISSGYSGDITMEIDTNKNQEDRCFFNNTDISLKTWARDEDGNTYYANKYSSSVYINVKSDIDWNAKYGYRDRDEYKNEEVNSSIKYETEYKNEDREISDVNYTYKYKYVYTYKFEYKYADKYIYTFPAGLYIDANNNYAGEYFKMNVSIPSVGIYENNSIPNDNRQLYLSLIGNTKMRIGGSYEITASFMEKLNNCNIRSKIITKTITIPSESLTSITYSVLIKTTKTLLSTTRTFISRERKD